jgi:6-pyruvoyltetrahydropterin/6-carboxytetrahydropterin synthase
MYTISATKSFDSAHFLAGYDGKCKNIHGHRWQVVIEISGETLAPDGEKRGMLVDFSKLKADLGAEADLLDHALIIERGTLKAATLAALADEDFRVIELDFRPTAENFAKYFYDRMTAKGYDVGKATVYETPDNCASFVRR